IAACSQAGGGHVLVPVGEWTTGAIELRSGVDLHLARGAVLRFSTDPGAYPAVPTRWEGVECVNYSALIHAEGQENIAVTGEGILDGQAGAGNWWGWTKRGSRLDQADRTGLFAMGEAGTDVAQRVFGSGRHLRPCFIEFRHSRNVLIEGVTIVRSPMWEIHPIYCDNVTVRGVQVVSHGPNNDGCDPDSCRDVLIDRCLFDTGDDCIAIKSGRNNDGRRVGLASENLIVRGCTMKDGHGGVVLGSEISGGCRNVFVEDCVMDSPQLACALRLKSNARRGGILENVFMRNMRIGEVAGAVLTVDLLYEEGARGDHPPVVRNVWLKNVESTHSPRVVEIAGFAGATIEGLHILDSTFHGVEEVQRLRAADPVELQNVTIDPAPKTVRNSSQP
ncbi:MAG: glycoside hydrolase family 28 protein, partial [Opitutales bacterium]